MLILNTGDWQLEAHPSNDRLDEIGRSVRFRENIEAIKRMLKVGWDRGCKVLAHNGDLTEHKNPRSSEIEAAAECFRYWIDLGGTIIAAAGNHDGAAYKVSSSSFAGLAIMAGKAFRIAHEITYYEDLNVVVIPYLHNKTLDQITALHREVRAKVKGPKMPWLVAHYGVQNCVIGAHNITNVGDMLGTEQVFPDGLGYSVGFFGHIHKQQVVRMMNGSDPVDMVFPGSPFPVDFGERNDPKGYAIYDTETNKYEVFQNTLDREWVELDLGDGTKSVEAAWTTPCWSAGALLKISGTYSGKIHPRQLFRAAVRNKQVPEPFCTPLFSVSPVTEIRANRGDAYSKIGSLREAAAVFIRDKYKDKPEALLAELVNLVTEMISDSKAAAFAPVMVPIDLEGEAFMTYKTLRYVFPQGQPTLLVGPNGLGKTNLMEAILFLFTGLTSKKLPISSLLRRGASEGYVQIRLADTESDSVFVIRRTLKRTSRGVTHKIQVTADTPQTGGPVDWVDGGVKEVQENLNQTLCVPYELVRTCYFMFQRMHDPDPFVMIEPLARKKILTEIFALGPLTVALKKLNDLRLEASKALETEKNKLAGMTTIFDAGSRTGLVQKMEGCVEQVKISRGLAAEKKEALGVSEGQVKAQETALNEARMAVKALPDTASALSAARASLEAENSSYARQYPETKARYKALDGRVKELEAQAGPDLENIIQEVLAQVTTQESSLRDTEQDIQGLAVKISEQTAEFNRVDRELYKVKLDLDKLVKDKITKCSLCGQDVDSSHIEAEIKKLEAQRDELALVLAGLPTGADLGLKKKELEDLKATKTKDIKALNDDVTRKRSMAQELKLKREELANAIADGKKLNAEHEKAVADFTQKLQDAQAKDDLNSSARAELDKVVEAAAQRVATASAELNLVRDRYNAAAMALQTDEQALAGAQERLADHDRTAELIKQTEQAIAAAGVKHDLLVMACDSLDPKTGLPVYLVDSRLDYLEEKINNYMAALGRPDIHLKLTTQDGDKETLAILIDDGAVDEKGEPLDRLDIRAYSGGQLTRMELAIKLALADLVEETRECKLGMFFMDEPTEGGLDDDGKEALIELLHDRAKAGWPVMMVISHDEKLIGAFSRRLEAEPGPEGETVLTMR